MRAGFRCDAEPDHDNALPLRRQPRFRHDGRRQVHGLRVTAMKTRAYKFGAGDDGVKRIMAIADYLKDSYPTLKRMGKHGGALVYDVIVKYEEMLTDIARRERFAARLGPPDDQTQSDTEGSR